MTTDRELDEILAEMGREHRAMGAPDSLEPVLRAAAVGRRYAGGKPGLRLIWTWAAVATLLAAVAGLIWETRRGHELQNQQVRTVPMPQVRHEPTIASAAVAGPVSVHTNGARTGRTGGGRGGVRDSSAKQATWSSLDEFVALPVSEGLPRAGELSVVRMELRGSDLQQYGLQAPPDAVARTMLAEFVVGEDGLPRAIRIVR